MSKFIIYTYQFSPVTHRQMDFIEENLSKEDLMKRKQSYFGEFISQTGDVYKRGGKKYGHKIIMNQDNIVVFRIANSKKLILEQNFQKIEHPYTPSCLVVVDNRNNVQRIAIEEDVKAFSDTNVVMNILLSTYKKHLEKKGLYITIQREYKKNEFWDVVNKYQDKVTMVRFQISYPNLPRLNQTIKGIISSTSEVTNSRCTTIEYKAGEGEFLNLSNEDDNIKELSEASADGGDIIKIKAKGIRHHITTGNTYKSFEIDELETSLKGDLFQNGKEKLVELLNEFLK